MATSVLCVSGQRHSVAPLAKATGTQVRTAAASRLARPRAAAPVCLGPAALVWAPTKQQQQRCRGRCSGMVVAGAAANASTAGNMDVTGDMLAPSAANNNVVRLLAASVAVLAMARCTGYLPGRGAAAVHLVAFAAWLGSTIWVTFIGGITMFKNMPRQMFGKVQAKLFPQYFALHAASLVLCAGTLLYGCGGLPQAQALTLGVSLAASLINLLFLEPAATKVMFARYDLENAPVRDEAAIKALYKKFGAFHGSSSLVNLVGMVGAVAHGWWLASRLVLV